MRAILATLFIMATGSTPVNAVDGGPHSFLSKIYFNYRSNGSGLNIYGNDAKYYFDRSMASLLTKDSQDAGGGTGSFDYDPLCTCQDFDIKNVHFSDLTKSKKSLLVGVNFDNFDKKSYLEITLVKTDDGWRISDISDKHTKSLKTLLIKSAALAK